MARNEEILGVFRTERFRFGDDAIIAEVETSAGQRITAKIQIEPDDEPVAGLTYRFYGYWTNHDRYGRQFAVSTFTPATPFSRAGVVRYLLDAPNIGQAIASALWNLYKGDAVKTLRERPEECSSAVKGLTIEKATAASQWLQAEAGLEGCTLELMELLAGRGFPKKTAKKAIQEWGNKAALIVRRNPYRLMAFRGCGFLRCDKLYLELGGRPDLLRRQALCAWYVLASDREGSTWQHCTDVARGIKAMVAGVQAEPIKAVVLATRAKLIEKRRDADGQLWLAEGRRGRNELAIAEKIAAMARGACQWPSVEGLPVSEHQRERLAVALAAPVSILTGSPGTGKTYALARVVGACLGQWGDGDVAVCAPTGKAAVRITEAMHAYGMKLKAKTIHSLLAVKSQSAGDGWGFEHDAGNPLPFKLVCVDETSMCDVDLFAHLVNALAPGTHLLLVGDVNQLPPVGHGAPLRDLIASPLVPSGELREIVRNDGTIVQSCAAIRDGRVFGLDEHLDPPSGKNLKCLSASSPEAAQNRIVEAIKKIRAAGEVDPIWDVQVIVAANDKSALSRRELNRILQNELNPSGEGRQGCPFRRGDKIVALKNGLMPLDGGDGERAFVANGELGAVEAVEDRYTLARFPSPERLIRIPRGRADEADDDDAGDEPKAAFDLGYAISCHKSQGSEWPIVIVAIDDYPGAQRVCTRNWIYTAISRAKLICFLVGRRETAYAMCRRSAVANRRTFLVERIEEERCKLESSLYVLACSAGRPGRQGNGFNGDSKPIASTGLSPSMRPS